MTHGIRSRIVAAALLLAATAPAGAQGGLDLREVDLGGFARIVAAGTGRTVVLDPSVSGQVDVAVPRGGLETLMIPQRDGDVVEVAWVFGPLPPARTTPSADGRADTVVVAGSTAFRNRVRVPVREPDTLQRAIATQVVRLSFVGAAQLEAVVARSAGGGATVVQGELAPVPEYGVSVVVDTRSSALTVTAPADPVATTVRAIHGPDARHEKALIEALVAEPSVRNVPDLPVQFGGILLDAVTAGARVDFEGQRAPPGLPAMVSGRRFASGNGGFFAGHARSGGVGFAGLLAAPSRTSTTRPLFAPSTAALDDQEAEIVVAQNVLVVTGPFATVGGTTFPDQPFLTIERRGVGLKQRVLSQIISDGIVSMAIVQEISNSTDAIFDTGGKITSGRSIRTNVIARDNEAVMLGGLVENGDGSVGQLMPGASNPSIICNLFRARSIWGDQHAVTMMLRPGILSPEAEARRVAREEARDARRPSDLIRPVDDGRFPRVPDARAPFGGPALAKPFDAHFVEDVPRVRRALPLSSALRLGMGRGK